jgi:hypothetical protein
MKLRGLIKSALTRASTYTLPNSNILKYDLGRPTFLNMSVCLQTTFPADAETHSGKLCIRNLQWKVKNPEDMNWSRNNIIFM